MGTFYLMLQAEKSINFLAFASSFFDLALLSILRRTNVMAGTRIVSSLCIYRPTSWPAANRPVSVFVMLTFSTLN